MPKQLKTSKKPCSINRLDSQYKGVLFFLLLTSLTGMGQATQYRHLSMGEYLDLAELVVVGDTFKNEQDKFIKVNKVLKGDKNYINKTLSLTNQHLDDPNKISITGGYRFPPIGVNDVAVLFNEDWPNLRKPSMFVYIYESEGDIENIKRMLKVFKIKNEDKKLNKLMKYALLEPLKNTAMQQQFITEAEQLKNDKSFNVVLEYFKLALIKHEKMLKQNPSAETIELSEDYFHHLIYVIRTLADIRAVPALISALSSSSEVIRNHVSDTLYFTFPGAPGVTEAFIQHQDTIGVHEMASNYLKKRFDYIDPNPRTPHPWYTANQLIKNNQLNAARKIYHQQLIAKDATFSDKLFTAKKLISIADNDDRMFIIKNLLPEIESELNQGISLTADDMVEILSDLKHPDTLPLLLKVLSMNFTQSSHEEALIAAVFALNDLGIKAIEQGETVILNRLKNKYKNQISTCCNDLKFLLALLWLNPEKSEQPHLDMFSDRFYGQIKNISGVSLADNEAAFMHDALINQIDIHPEVKLWVSRRLSYLKDEQGIPLLIKFLAANDDRSYIYQPALISIGGEATKKAMLALFTHPKKWLRTTAINVYAKLAEKEILPYLRKMTTQSGYGDLEQALTYFYYYGTPEDLPYMNKNCNFWNSENGHHDWTCHARYGIWDRHGYDLNGPIKKVSGHPR